MPEGKRVVDISALAASMKCKSCNELLNLQEITEERLKGLSSIFIIPCQKCKINNEACTSKMTKINNKHYEENNTSVILGKFYIK